ncbi:MAG: 3'-5' exonuclease [Chloroflexota bacterium]|nr:3'-5' exonuclease [Chloroflexota bacterium]
MRLLIVDVEAGGFEAQKHALLEIGAVVANHKLDELDRFHAIICPSSALVVGAEALKVTGLALRELSQTGIPERSAILGLLGFAAKHADGGPFPILAGWNISFDSEFLMAACRRHGLGWPFSHRMMDVQSVWAFHQGWNFNGLTDAARKILDDAPQHRALSDALLTLRLLKALFEGRDLGSRATPHNTTEDVEDQHRPTSS